MDQFDPTQYEPKERGQRKLEHRLRYPHARHCQWRGSWWNAPKKLGNSMHVDIEGCDKGNVMRRLSNRAFAKSEMRDVKQRTSASSFS